VTLVNGNINSRPCVEGANISWSCREPSGKSVGSTARSVYRGERVTSLCFPYSWLLTISVFSATSWLFPYNRLLIISVFPRAKLMFFSYSSFLLVK